MVFLMIDYSKHSGLISYFYLLVSKIYHEVIMRINKNLQDVHELQYAL